MSANCDHLSDRLPEIAAGTRGKTGAESAHLAACQSCALELELVRATRALGGDLRLTGTVEEAVVSAWRLPPRRRRAHWPLPLGLAASVLLATALWRGDRRDAASLPLPVVGTEALTAEELLLILPDSSQELSEMALALGGDEVPHFTVDELNIILTKLEEP